jgi:MerR family transcriptional regulator, light-induced transcriptional regulator
MYGVCFAAAARLDRDQARQMRLASIVQSVHFRVVRIASPRGPQDHGAVRTLKTSEAAALLNVSPNTLRAWERRFGYPRPQRSAGRHRLYTHGEIVALRDALQQGLSISSAVSRAREALSTDTHALVGALTAFELDRADSAMEAALALRSVECSVEEVLLPSLSELGLRFGTDSAAWAFAARWADGWLRRAQRLAPPPVRRLGVLIGDATGAELDPDALALRALELFCARSGARVMALPVAAVSCLGEVVESLQPDAVVIAGTRVSDDDVALWAYRVRAAAGALPMALFRRAHQGKVRATGSRVLAEAPFAAHRQLLVLVDRLPRGANPVALVEDADVREAQA